MLMQEKKAAKEEKLKQEEKYMWAIVDGVKEKVIISAFNFFRRVWVVSIILFLTSLEYGLSILLSVLV